MPVDLTKERGCFREIFFLLVVFGFVVFLLFGGFSLALKWLVGAFSAFCFFLIETPLRGLTANCEFDPFSVLCSKNCLPLRNQESA